jgi:hypothetical protein
MHDKQIPLCVPRLPKRGGTEKARDFVRDDSDWTFSVKFVGVLYAGTACRAPTNSTPKSKTTPRALA